MIQFFLGFMIMTLAMCCLAIGVLFGRPPLRSSCSGDDALKACTLCKREKTS